MSEKKTILDDGYEKYHAICMIVLWLLFIILGNKYMLCLTSITSVVLLFACLNLVVEYIKQLYDIFICRNIHMLQMYN